MYIHMTMYIYTIILQLYVKTYMISCMSASALVQALAGGCSDHVRQCMSQHRQHIPFGNVFWQADLLEVQIEAIRSEMDIEVNRLIAIIHKKNVDLTDLETKLVNRLRWGIVVLQSKNENLIRRQVLQWWRYAWMAHGHQPAWVSSNQCRLITAACCYRSNAKEALHPCNIGCCTMYTTIDGQCIFGPSVYTVYSLWCTTR